ncbi:putative mitochondrial protein, partial [Mucuna pruriens]
MRMVSQNKNERKDESIRLRGRRSRHRPSLEEENEIRTTALVVIVIDRNPNLMNIIRSLLTRLPPMFHLFYSFLIIIPLLGVFYCLCLKLGSMDFFQSLLLKIGFSLGSRFLSFAFLKLGLAGGLAMAIVFAVRTLLIGGEFQPYPLMMSSEGPNQGWTDLLGSSESESAGTSSSVNQQGARPAPAPNEVAPPVVPYPYPENEIIGGDSVESIERRLLGRFFSPSAHDIQMARIQAEDLFEVKVDILRVMAGGP